MDLGWVDIDFAHSCTCPILLGQLEVGQNGLQLGKMMENSNQSQPNPGPRPPAPPCRTLNFAPKSTLFLIPLTSAVAAVFAPDERRDTLDVVEVEWVLARHRAVQPRLQIRRPGIPAKGGLTISSQTSTCDRNKKTEAWHIGTESPWISYEQALDNDTS